MIEKKGEGKKGVRNHITLLRAPTLAAFLPWGNSEGASCMTLTGRKNTVILEKSKRLAGFILESSKNYNDPVVIADNEVVTYVFFLIKYEAGIPQPNCYGIFGLYMIILN